MQRVTESLGVDDFDPRAQETWESTHREPAQLRAHRPVAHTSAWNGFWMLTRVLNRFFTREKVLEMQGPIRRIAAELLDPLIAAGSCDFCVDFVHPLPGRVFAVFFNLPESTAMRIREITRGYDAALQSADDSLVKQASLDLYEIAREMIAERRARPLPVQDDPTSALLAATDADGAPLPDDMVLGTLVFPEGDRFILDRPNICEHLAFGAGPHRCAGAPLAVELFRIVLEELLARTRAISVEGPVRMSGWPEIGTLSVPVALAAA